MTSDDSGAAFDDNFIDLLPGETRTVYVKTSAPLESIRAGLHIQSLSDAFPSHNDSPEQRAR
jgi:hypothetical protein